MEPDCASDGSSDGGAGTKIDGDAIPRQGRAWGSSRTASPPCPWMIGAAKAKRDGHDQQTLRYTAGKDDLDLCDLHDRASRGRNAATCRSLAIFQQRVHEFGDQIGVTSGHSAAIHWTQAAPGIATSTCPAMPLGDRRRLPSSVTCAQAAFTPAERTPNMCRDGAKS